jgi:hypothetical protein
MHIQKLPREARLILDAVDGVLRLGPAQIVDDANYLDADDLDEGEEVEGAAPSSGIVGLGCLNGSRCG